MKTLLLLLLLAIPCFAQQRCVHSSTIERFEDVRITAPGKIISFTGKTIEFVVEDGKIIQATSIEIDERTVLPTNFIKTYKQGKYYVVFCVKHHYPYQILPYIEPK